MDTILGLFENCKQLEIAAGALLRAEVRGSENLVALMRGEAHDDLAAFGHGQLGHFERTRLPYGGTLALAATPEVSRLAVNSAATHGLSAALVCLGIPFDRAAGCAERFIRSPFAIVIRSESSVSRESLELLMKHRAIQVFQNGVLQDEKSEGKAHDEAPLITRVRLSEDSDVVIREDSGERFVWPREKGGLESEILERWTDITEVRLEDPIDGKDYVPLGPRRFVAWLEKDTMDDAYWRLSPADERAVDSRRVKILVNPELGDATVSLEAGCLMAWNLFPREIRTEKPSSDWSEKTLPAIRRSRSAR